MTKRAHGQVRRSQVITTYGPGALIDLPGHSAIVGGLEDWPRTGDLEEIEEPRLARKLQVMTGVSAPRMYAPPPESNDPRTPERFMGAWLFPEWFVVQEQGGTGEHERSRRLVRRQALDDKRRFESRAVVATRFVRACPKGHVDDVDWWYFVHGAGNKCRRQLWLDERGTSGDLGDLVVRCECGQSRGMKDATIPDASSLGPCEGARPWLGKDEREGCSQASRLLIRTASNAYFPQVVSALSLPDRGSAIDGVVGELWDDLQIVEDAGDLALLKKKPRITQRLATYGDAEVLAAIRQRRSGKTDERPVKDVELGALLAAPEGFGEDVPVDPNFHARRLPDRMWRKTEVSADVQAVIQVHRLREVLALAGFTRLEPVMPDVNGEYETDVPRAQLALEPSWFPAVENRGEGVFVQLSAPAVKRWLEQPAVERRLDALARGHEIWAKTRRHPRPFPGGPYVLLHTLSHLLIQSVSMRCGYPASSIRERVYADDKAGRYGILLYTGCPDAEGTLGGLVQQGRHFEDHLARALQASSLCSNDPICAHHVPGESLEGRYLHGAACHGCALIAETSCEMRNDYLDRALVVPILGDAGASFFTRAG